MKVEVEVLCERVGSWRMRCMQCRARTTMTVCRVDDSEHFENESKRSVVSNRNDQGQGTKFVCECDREIKILLLFPFRGTRFEIKI